MLVYEGTKHQFQIDMDLDIIPGLLDDLLSERMNQRVSKQEKLSWRNSMQYMYKVLNDQDIPDNCGVAIEFNIPRTTKRVDFILSGYNREHKGSAIIIELKQWTHVKPVFGCSDLVETELGRACRKVAHPSYQAWSYVNYMNQYIENVEKKGIQLYPCAYLHNYDLTLEQDIINPIYRECVEKSPVFTQGKILELREFIKQHLHIGDDKQVLYDIENGRIVPSKSLQDCVASMMAGNEEYTLLDEQKVVYEDILKLARQCVKDRKKRVLIAKGGCGTGKSVIAVHVLAKLIQENMMCQYVTKNAAPRNVYRKKMAGKMDQTTIQSLFTTSDEFYKLAEPDCLDVALVDEAHRLRQLSGLYGNLGENQIKEIMQSSLLSVYFIDPFQRVTYKDFGSIAEIKQQAELLQADVMEYDLVSQFRCNGSDGYIAWLRNVLEMEANANDSFQDIAFDFQVFDDPQSLMDTIRRKNEENGKSRMVAGYCWDWKKADKKNPDVHEIKIDGFEMSWNLDITTPYVLSESSIDQAGCIHTVQGLEFDYVGVIIGNDVRYENGILTDHTKRAKTDKSLNGMKKDLGKDPEAMKKTAREIILNTYYTLMTRGMKGCYVYCCDHQLQAHLKEMLQK